MFLRLGIITPSFDFLIMVLWPMSPAAPRDLVPIRVSFPGPKRKYPGGASESGSRSKWHDIFLFNASKPVNYFWDFSKAYPEPSCVEHFAYFFLKRSLTRWSTPARLLLPIFMLLSLSLSYWSAILLSVSDQVSRAEDANSLYLFPKFCKVILNWILFPIILLSYPYTPMASHGVRRIEKYFLGNINLTLC